MEYIELSPEDKAGICEMSKMATAIVREQLKSGYHYFFVREENRNLGFLAFYPKKDVLYLSKFYLYKSERGKGYSHDMMTFVITNAKELKLNGIELNVNKHNSACRAYESLGFKIVRSEKNDIGNGFYMDDYVYRLDF